MSRNITAFASSARTATESSTAIISTHGGCNVVIDMTAVTATGDVTFKLEGHDPLSGAYYTIIESLSVVTVSTVVLSVFGGITEVANSKVSDGLPQNIRVTATHANAVAMTYSVGLNYTR